MSVRPATRLQREIRRVADSCGGVDELAFLLHVTPRTAYGYTSGRSKPIRTVCLQLARICRTLDGPASARTDVEWWLALTASQE